VTKATGSLRKHDRIVEELHKLILSGELPRGTRLQQDQLAARFDTSITPVREALRLLESQGLVISEAHRGVRIAAIDEEDLKATYVMRRLLEPYAVRRATLRVSRKDLLEAERLNERMVAAATVGDRWGVREANRAYHFVFYERCGLPSLAERIEGLWLVFPWDISLLNVDARTDASAQEHRAIIEAVRDGDDITAADVTAAHLLRSYLAVMERLTGQPAIDPFQIEND